MAANRLPASWMNALDPAAGARPSRWTAARAGAPRCPYISRRSRPASGQTLIVPSSFGRGESPRRLRAPLARNVIPGAHASDRARGRSRHLALLGAAAEAGVSRKLWFVRWAGAYLGIVTDGRKNDPELIHSQSRGCRAFDTGLRRSRGRPARLPGYELPNAGQGH